MSTISNSNQWRISPSAMVKPVIGTVPRREGSVRRTSHIDMLIEDHTLHLVGAARDLRTDADGAHLLAHATVDATASPTRHLVQLDTTPQRPGTDALVGLLVGPGFREAVHRNLPDDVAASTPLALMLDDLPVAAIISGYTYMFAEDSLERTGTPGMKADICSGWRSDGTMLVTLRERGAIPIPVGPPATRVESDDDADGWHDIPPLAIGAMRRRRLVDVSPGDTADTLFVQGMFRDSYHDHAGHETVVHEYTVTATVERESLLIRACDAVPRVLPWVECPVAAASAWKLVGHPTSRVRDVVRTDLRGVSTCTHLNDLLRSLGDVGALAAAMP